MLVRVTTLEVVLQFIYFSAITDNPAAASGMDPVVVQIFCAQVKLLKKDKRSIRWHPEVVRRCLEIARRSSSSYDILRRTISLPSRRILYEYSSAIPYAGGISLPFIGEAIKAFQAAIQAKGSHAADRTVALVFDGMSLRKGLVARRDGTVTGVAIRFLIFIVI